MIFRYRVEWEIEADTMQEAKKILGKFSAVAPEAMEQTMEVLEAVEESLVKETYE